MRFSRNLLIMAACAMALTACGKKEPKGQVVATVEGKEVTATELNNELNGFNAPNAQIRKQAEQAALNAVIRRKILAQAAEKAGVAKTPAFAQQEQKLREVLLVEMWQQQLAKSVPQPSPEEVRKFITEHPDVYAQHKVWSVDQLRFPRITDASLAKALQPLNTLEQISAELNARKIPNRMMTDEIDTLAVEPAVAEQIAKLPATEVFILPVGNVLVANHIRDTKVAPVDDALAVRHATAYLKQLHTQEAVRRQFQASLAAAQKDVQYSKAYKPAAPAPAAKPAAAPAAPAAK